MRKRSSSSSEARRRTVAALAAGMLLGAGSSGAARAQVAAALTDPIATLDRSAPIGFHIEAPAPDSGAHEGDAELCRWALDDWVRHAEGRLGVVPADASDALIRVFFVAPESGQYGEMRPMRVDGRRGAAVFVRPQTDALGPDIARAAAADPLLRDTIVYLTCLHELGHALGLAHTADFEDVMYFFGFGGDIPEFFGRYRSRLATRDDIRRESGLSSGDVARLLAAYAEP